MTQKSKTPRIITATITALISVIALAPLASADERAKIIVDIPPTAAILQSIIGDEADIEILISPNHDAHHFSLSPRDVSKLANADMVFGIGSLFMPELVKAAKNIRNDTPAYFYSDQNTDAQSLNDPHIWLSQSELVQMREAFWDAWQNTGQTPASPRNAWALDETGHIDFGEEITQFANQNAPLIASHAAFANFENDNHITSFGALQDVNDQPLPPRQFAQIMTEIEAGKIKCMLLETSEHSHDLEHLAEDNDLKILEFDILGWQYARDPSYFPNYFRALNQTYANCN